MFKIINIIILLFLTIPHIYSADFSSKDHIPRCNEKTLKKIAEEEGYGYKYANLSMLEELITWFNEANKSDGLLPIQVPSFFGIPHPKIVDFLREVGFDIEEKWTAVLKNVPTDTHEESLRSKQLPDLFWTKQKEFIAELNIALDKIIEKFSVSSFKEVVGNSTADKLVEDAGTHAFKFMVRSTGKEDTRTLANAGGNDSIPNVMPSQRKLWESAKAVILSYFGEKSLKQRLGLGDESLLRPETFCPVLFQYMIAESPEHLTHCGVMFTEETEGGISYKGEVDDNGRIKTTGITIIQAAYGHNEGVVNSLIAVDTFVAHYLQKSSNPVFYPLIRAKRERLVPSTDSTELIMVPNSPNLILSPALDNKELITLKKFADALELYYGYPLDVEFVIHNQTIFIVQARPIVHREGRAGPSFVERIEQYPQDFLLKGRTIVAAGGAVIQIDEKSQAIIAPNIGVALEQYLKAQDRQSFRKVSTGKDAPRTSHEATTFRNENKPVMHVNKIDFLNSRFTPDNKLLVSPLQHRILIVPHEKNITILPGWYAYPLVPEVSVCNHLFIHEEELDLLKANLIDASNIKPGKVTMENWSVLIDRMKNSDSETVKETIKLFLGQLNHSIKKYLDQLDPDSDLETIIREFRHAIIIICMRIIATSTITQDDPLYTNRLLPILYLEALTYQQLPHHEVLNAHSIASLLNMLRQEAGDPLPKPIKFGHENNKSYYRQLKKMSAILFEDTAKEMWSILLNATAKEDTELFIGSLSQLCADLEKLNLLPIWLHSVMVENVQKVFESSPFPNSLTIGKIANLLKKWNAPLKEDKVFLDEIKQLRGRISSFQVNGFEDPKKFTAIWGQFKRTILDPVTSAGFKANFKKSTEITRLASCFMLNELVDLFDRCIKIVKGNPHTAMDEKLSRFKEMLQTYQFLLKRHLLPLVPENSIKYGNANQQKFLALVEVVLQRRFTPPDLEATSGFNVMSFTIGSGVDVDSTEPKPKTGEDAFTTIHQDLLVCISILIAVNGGSKIVRPSLLNAVESLLKAATTDRASLIGCNVNNKGIQLHYNCPLANHSSQFFLNFDNKTKKVYLTVQFYGHAPERWYTIANYALLTDLAKVSQVQNFEITENGSGFTFVIDTHSNLAIIQETIQDMITFTFQTSFFATAGKAKIDRFIATLKDSSVDPREALNALHKRIGLKALPSCQWFFEWCKELTPEKFVEAITPSLIDYFSISGKRFFSFKNAQLTTMFANGLGVFLQNPKTSLTSTQIQQILPIYLSHLGLPPKEEELMRQETETFLKKIFEEKELKFSSDIPVPKIEPFIKKIKEIIIREGKFYTINSTETDITLQWLCFEREIPYAASSLQFTLNWSDSKLQLAIHPNVSNIGGQTKDFFNSPQLAVVKEIFQHYKFFTRIELKGSTTLPEFHFSFDIKEASQGFYACLNFIKFALFTAYNVEEANQLIADLLETLDDKQQKLLVIKLIEKKLWGDIFFDSSQGEILTRHIAKVISKNLDMLEAFIEAVFPANTTVLISLVLDAIANSEHYDMGIKTWKLLYEKATKDKLFFVTQTLACFIDHKALDIENIVFKALQDNQINLHTCLDNAKQKEKISFIEVFLQLSFTLNSKRVFDFFKEIFPKVYDKNDSYEDLFEDPAEKKTPAQDKLNTYTRVHTMLQAKDLPKGDAISDFATWFREECEKEEIVF